MVNLELYNVHKRHTLDRLSGKYAFRAREVLRKETSRYVEDFIAAVKAGAHFRPDIKKLKSDLHGLLSDHEYDVIHVGVSDGIQEVSPEQELHLWANYPIDFPVELQLQAELATKRNKWAEHFITRRRLITSIADFVTDITDEYLRNIRKAYTRAASDWLDYGNDESPGVEAVIKNLQEALRQTDNYARKVFCTETTNYFNDARVDYFADNTAVDYVQLYAVTDGRISKICEDRHRFVVTIRQAKLPKYKPAFHPFCRTIQRPLISSLKSDMALIKAGLAMNEASFEPLPEGWG